MGELPLPVLPLMGNTGMHPCQGSACLTAMARTTHFPRQRPIGFAQSPERRAKRLGGREPGTIMARQKGLQPKVKACALTCHDSGNGLVVTEAGKDH